MDRRKRPECERGLALVAVVMYLGIIGLLASAFFVTVNRELSQVAAQENREVSLALAEGALDKALAELLRDPAYAGEAETSLGDGVYAVTVEPGTDGYDFRIDAVGRLVDEGLVRAEARILADAAIAGGRVTALRWTEVHVR